MWDEKGGRVVDGRRSCTFAHPVVAPSEAVTRGSWCGRSAPPAPGSTHGPAVGGRRGGRPIRTRRCRDGGSRQNDEPSQSTQTCVNFIEGRPGRPPTSAYLREDLPQAATTSNADVRASMGVTDRGSWRSEGILPCALAPNVISYAVGNYIGAGNYELFNELGNYNGSRAFLLWELADTELGFAYPHRAGAGLKSASANIEGLFSGRSVSVSVSVSSCPLLHVRQRVKRRRTVVPKLSAERIIPLTGHARCHGLLAVDLDEKCGQG